MSKPHQNNTTVDGALFQGQLALYTQSSPGDEATVDVCAARVYSAPHQQLEIFEVEAYCRCARQIDYTSI